MQTTDHKHIEHLVALCAAAGIREVVLSPGSRNAPLIIAFDAVQSIKKFLVHDERSAAFFALGMAESTGRPVALCCTSGSAVLNYAPAISEAYYRRIPLLVLTADRPIELVDQGDGQTIRQKNVFQNFVKSQFQLPNHDDENQNDKSDKTVIRSLNELFNLPFGPVHLNIPLNEPLYGLKAPGIQFENPVVSVEIAELTKAQLSEISQIWLDSTKIMILVGQQSADEQDVARTEKFLSTFCGAVLTENTSGLTGDSICYCIDRTLAGLRPEDESAFTPDLVVTLGGAIISKRIKTFLRKYKPAAHWRIGRFHFEEDSFGALTQSIKMDAGDFLSLAAGLAGQKGNYGSLWKDLDARSTLKHRAFLNSSPFCDLSAFEQILSALPAGCDVHLGNSSVVRYAQLFQPNDTVRYFSNRGVSGIDGCASTAVGFSIGTNRLNVLITGDISFFYDGNAFWNNHLHSRLRIIVINNGGGGIFRYLPGPSETPQLNYFVAPHCGNIEKFSAAHDLSFRRADSADTLKKGLKWLFGVPPANRPGILEVDTSTVQNEEILKKYFNDLTA